MCFLKYLLHLFKQEYSLPSVCLRAGLSSFFYDLSAYRWKYVLTSIIRQSFHNSASFCGELVLDGCYMKPGTCLGKDSYYYLKYEELIYAIQDQCGSFGFHADTSTVCSTSSCLSNAT